MGFLGPHHGLARTIKGHGLARTIKGHGLARTIKGHGLARTIKGHKTNVLGVGMRRVDAVHAQDCRDVDDVLCPSFRGAFCHVQRQSDPEVATALWNALLLAFLRCAEYLERWSGAGFRRGAWPGGSSMQRSGALNRCVSKTLDKRSSLFGRKARAGRCSGGPGSNGRTPGSPR